MRYVTLGLCWLVAILLGLVTASMVLLGQWIPAALLALAALLCLPPVGSLVRRPGRSPVVTLLRAVAVVGLVVAGIGLLLRTEATSIYASPAVESRLMAIYDRKMSQWPVPYEELFLPTRYGTVHVIASGPPEGPPLLLLHASGVAGWSWKYNVAGLSRRYRTFAIDQMGDAGKSRYDDLRHTVRDGRDQAALYGEIMDRLGVRRACVVGASEGGFIATNLALHAPERVEKLVLIGPMGYAGTVQSVVRIMLTQMFPLRPIQESTFAWAFSDHARLKADFGEWFRLLMGGCRPYKVVPMPFSPSERRSLRVPVLFVFGERDHLVGDPEAARARVSDVPDARVEVVPGGHLMAAELPERVNALVAEFIEGGPSAP